MRGRIGARDVTRAPWVLRSKAAQSPACRRPSIQELTVLLHATSIFRALCAALPCSCCLMIVRFANPRRNFFSKLFPNFSIELLCQMYLAKLFFKIVYGTVAQKHCQAEVLGAV